MFYSKSTKILQKVGRLSPPQGDTVRSDAYMVGPFDVASLRHLSTVHMPQSGSDY